MFIRLMPVIIAVGLFAYRLCFSLGQMMINSEVSGVAFSRHPLKPVSCQGVYIEAVHGIGEGLVSGELDPDSYEVRP